MNKHALLLPIAVCLAVIFTAGELYGQSISPGARVHYAGRDVVMLDGVEIDGRLFRAYITADEEGTWRLTNLEMSVGDRIPDDIVLDLAELSATGERTLTMRHVFLDGQFYTGTFTFDRHMETVETYSFVPSEPPVWEDHPILSQLATVYAGEISDRPEGEPIIQPDVNEESTDQRGVRDEETTPGGSIGDRSTTSTTLGVDEVTAFADGVSADLRSLNTRMERIETTVDQLSRDVATGLAAGEERLDRLFAELGRVRDEQSRSAATRDLEPSDETPPAVPTAYRDQTLTLPEARVLMTRLQTVDLRSSQPIEGEWEMTAEAARQTNSAARFAKLRVPYEQDGRPRLYRFVGKALHRGWAGLGLHFSIEGVERPRGYGHGQSFLIWLTRDESVYGTDDTFLEIYRSYDDVDMNRVSQVRTRGNLREDHVVEVLFDPGSGFVTVAVNGIEHVRYRLEYPGGASVELALRALNQAEFRHLEVRTLP